MSLGPLGFGQRLKDEQGGIIVAAAIAMLALAMLGAVMVQVGDWFQHRRHIQVRADAAALAGGQVFNQCFNVPSSITEAGADAAIEDWAKNYGGLASDHGGPFNSQFGTSSSNLMSFQSTSYPTAAVPQPTRDLDNECFKADGTANLMLDVKMTQDGIPGLFSFTPLGTVHSWARVALQTITSAHPSMPLAIPDVNPKAVAVTFVDDSTGEALAGCANGCVFPLTGPVSSTPLNNWGGTATIPVPSANTNIGMRVSIGSQAGSCAGVNSTATYTCFDYSTGGKPSDRGIIRIRSYSSGGSGSTSAPILRGVTPSTCSLTPFFSSYSAPGGSCNVQISADIDFGGTVDYTLAHVRANITGASGGTTTVTMHHGSGTSWTSDVSSLPVGGGPYDVTIDWKYDKGSFKSFAGGSPVQQIYAGSDGTDLAQPGGPILAATITDSSNNPAYSLTAGSTPTLNVAIGLTGGVHLAQRCSIASGNSGAKYSCPGDPPVRLRFQTSGSLNYAIDCGTLPGNNGGNLYQQIRYGCANSFSINTADVCPDTASPTPPDCAPVQTGAAVGQLQQAMNARFAPSGSCLPNNYPDTGVDADKRIVTLIDTDFTAFSGSGGSSSSDVPVVTFATFYVTGWDGADSSCSGVNEAPPAGFKATGNTADVWGHFIKYETGGTTNGTQCDLTTIAPCVAALVR